MNIKNIIFDLGGVILDIDYNLTAQAFKDLGLKNFDEIYSQKKQQHFFDDFEKGLISSMQFRSEVKNLMPVPVSDNQIDDAWNAMLKFIPEERITWLKLLKERYNLYLLSNTNEIHIEAFKKIIQLQFYENVLESIFDRCYYSSEHGIRKPDPQIFQLVLDENKLIASESIFIDDSPQHLEGAISTGIHAVWLEPGKQVMNVIDEALKNF